jgi:molecular chaperone HtpG
VALEFGRQRRVHARAGRTRPARHLGDPAPEARRRRVPAGLDAEVAGASLQRPHRVPDPHGQDRRGRGGAEAPAPELETVNEAKALWTLPKAEIKDEDYQAFYKHISHDFNDALAWTHNRVEGNQNFTLLLFCRAAPFDFQYDRDERKGLKLYVKRVFIMDAAEQMLPSYLRFVRGVVDSDDLPLNVSRELLQNNRQLDKLKRRDQARARPARPLAREDAEKYPKFWKSLRQRAQGRHREDHGNRERIAKLLRFASHEERRGATSCTRWTTTSRA